jgi:hypothetical protein
MIMDALGINDTEAAALLKKYKSVKSVIEHHSK